MGVGSISMLSVPIVIYKNEKVECVENENTSVAWLSEVEIDVVKRIVKMLNKDQSVARHSLRMNNLASLLAECGNEIVSIKGELSENAWVSQQFGENGLELFSSIEEIVLEIQENAMNRVFERMEIKREEKMKIEAKNEIGTKRKRELDQCEYPVKNSDENKKQKVIPLNENLKQMEKKRNTAPKLRKNVQKKKENTTPAPILNFLNKFNFKPKKIKTKKQESEFKIVKKGYKNGK